MRLSDLIKQLRYEIVRRLITLQPAGTINSKKMATILRAKMNDMGCKAEIYIPDAEMKVYRKEDVIRFLRLNEVNEISYIPGGIHDCDDFAAKLFGKGFSLVWTDKHALNYFIDVYDNYWFVEPQADKIAANLASWQGERIRFFLGR